MTAARFQKQIFCRADFYFIIFMCNFDGGFIFVTGGWILIKMCISLLGKFFNFPQGITFGHRAEKELNIISRTNKSRCTSGHVPRIAFVCL